MLLIQDGISKGKVLPIGIPEAIQIFISALINLEVYTGLKIEIDVGGFVVKQERPNYVSGI